MKDAKTVFSPAHRPLTLGILILPESSMISIAATIDPLRAANRFSRHRRFSWKILTPNGGPAPLSCGIALPADGDLGATTDCDVLIVIGGFNSARHADTRLVARLRGIAGRMIALGGIEAGTWVLARAGLLDGHRATTHWEDLEAFAEQFPEVDVIHDRFTVSRNRFTAGGASPAMDMMLELIRARHGAPLALQVASAFIYDTVHAATDPQPLVSRGRLKRAQPQVARAISIMEETLEDPVPVQAIANRLGLSLRTLEGLFSRNLGLGPGAYFRRLRLEMAARLVRDTALPMQAIAVRCGFASQAAFSRAFRRQFGLSPSALRQSPAAPPAST